MKKRKQDTKKIRERKIKIRLLPTLNESTERPKFHASRKEVSQTLIFSHFKKILTNTKNKNKQKIKTTKPQKQK